VAFLKEDVIAVQQFSSVSASGEGMKREVYHWVGTFNLLNFLEDSALRGFVYWFCAHPAHNVA